jgi:hypothetical protein
VEEGRVQLQDLWFSFEESGSSTCGTVTFTIKFGDRNQRQVSKICFLFLFARLLVLMLCLVEVAAQFLRRVVKPGDLPVPAVTGEIVLKPGDVLPSRPGQFFHPNRKTNITTVDVGVAVAIGRTDVDHVAGKMGFSDHFGPHVLRNQPVDPGKPEPLRSKVERLLDKISKLEAQRAELLMAGKGLASGKLVAELTKEIEELEAKIAACDEVSGERMVTKFVDCFARFRAAFFFFALFEKSLPGCCCAG